MESGHNHNHNHNDHNHNHDQHPHQKHNASHGSSNGDNMGKGGKGIFGIINIIIIIVAIVFFVLLYNLLTGNNFEDGKEVIEGKQISVESFDTQSSSYITEEEALPLTETADELLTPFADGVYVYDFISSGTEPMVDVGNVITAQYLGFFEDGTQFANSKGMPLIFSVGSPSIVSGLSSGVVGMSVGDVRLMKLDSSVAYGPQGSTNIPPNTDLYFAIFLEDIAN